MCQPGIATKQSLKKVYEREEELNRDSIKQVRDGAQQAKRASKAPKKHTNAREKTSQKREAINY